MTDKIHIVKLCVGANSIEDLANWQQAHRGHWPEGQAMHVTRMFPKREAEVLNGGSLYWVIKGVVLARQRIIGLKQVESADGISRCGLVLDAEIIRTVPTPRRPFQGWRYLEDKDAPADIPKGKGDSRAHEEPLPPALALALSEIGLI